MKKCVIFSFANLKGGVGKTSITVNLAGSLVSDKEKILLIDNDPNGNLSSHFGLEIDEESYTVEDVYVSKNPPDIHEMAAEVRPNLWVLASSPGLGSVVSYLSSKPNREMRLKNFLDNMDGKFDYIMIDNPPSLNILTLNALIASDRVIIPTQLEDFSVEGVQKVNTIIQDIKKRFNPKLIIQGVLPNMVNDRRKISKTAREKLDGFKVPVFKSSIRSSVKVPESAEMFKLLIEHGKCTSVNEDILNVRDELLSTLK
ncbi:MAG: ParA family protein [Planctomycetes bacterium]|nr:ParA family protein [Planctomycetota bacterium]